MTQSALSPSPKFSGKTLASYGIVFLFVVLCGWYFVAHRKDFAFLSAVSCGELVAAGVFVFVSHLIIAYQYRLFLTHFGLSLSFPELTAMTAGMLLGNLVLPFRGGSGGLAVYLKRMHDLDFQAFAAIYGGTALLAALVNAALAMLGLVELWVEYQFVHIPLNVFVIGAFVCCLYLCLFPPQILPREGFIGKLLGVIHSWRHLSQNRKLLLHLTGSFLALALVLWFSFYFIYRAMGMEVSLAAVLITSSLGGIANLVPLTPGSLGIFDAVVIQVPQLFGFDPARSVAGALVFRLLSFLWGLLLGLPGLLYLFRVRSSETETGAERF